METIIESGNHYLLQLKRNQPSLYREMADELPHQPLDLFQESQKTGGKQVSWTVSVFDVSQHDKVEEWPNLSRLVHVHKEVVDTKSGNISHSDRLYISDLHGGDASYYAKVIRGHWAVENLLHRVKDVQHGEDKNGISGYNAAMNVSTLGSMALNLHRNNGRTKIKKAQLFAAANCGEMVCEIRT